MNLTGQAILEPTQGVVAVGMSTIATIRLGYGDEYVEKTMGGKALWTRDALGHFWCDKA